MTNIRRHIVSLVGVNVTPNDDHEAWETDDDVSHEVDHELGLRVVFLEVGEVGEEEREEQVAAGNGNGGSILLEVTFRRGDSII